MAENSKIEWTDHTFNPWIGCTKVSPACDNCYAEAMMDKRYGRVTWGAGEDRQKTSASNWKLPYKWDRQAMAAGTRPFVFCASLADVFDNEVDPLWRHQLFALINDTPNLIWLLLTKRIGNVSKMTDPMVGNPCLPQNAALGATLANQEEYDRDRMKLWDIRERFEPVFTFASIEPMLGPVILDKHAPDWIICGGESGRDAREMNPQWARDLRDGARRFGRRFFMKQMTGKKPIPADLMVRELPLSANGPMPHDLLGETIRRNPIQSQREVCKITARCSIAALGPVHSDDDIRNTCVGLAIGLFDEAFSGAPPDEQQRMLGMMEEEYRKCIAT